MIWYNKDKSIMVNSNNITCYRFGKDSYNKPYINIDNFWIHDEDAVKLWELLKKKLKE